MPKKKYSKPLPLTDLYHAGPVDTCNLCQIPDAGLVDTITMQEFDESCLVKRKSMTERIHIEGNNGADYLTIIPLGGNLLQIEVGHCCVVTLIKIVPVEFLTALITNSIEAFGIEEIINQLWGKYGPVLCAQVKDIL